MRVYGIDFTSRPRKGKPMVCIECELKGDVLHAGELFEWHSFEEFEAATASPRPLDNRDGFSIRSAT